MQGIVDNFLNLVVLDKSLTLLWIGFVFTIKLVVSAFLLALVAGFLLVYLRTSRRPALRNIAIAYIDIVRSIPPLVSLVLVYYALPIATGISLDTLSAAILTFGLIQAAYVSEIYRGGLNAIVQGQYDALHALGFKKFLGYRLVIAPQIFRIILPTLTSQATQMVKDSPLAFYIGYAELLTRAREASNLFSNFTPLFAAAGIYCAILLLLQYISYQLERRGT